MIFKLRMLSGETDGFVREYEVPESTDLLQLHDLVCGDLGYDPFNFSSFFAADSGWNKLQESGSDGGGYRGGRRERPFQRYDGGIRRFRGYGRRWIRR